MNVEIYEEKKKITFLEIIIPLFYILNQYKVMKVSLGLLAIIFAIATVIIKKKALIAYSPLLALFMFMLFHDVFKMFVAGFAINSWIERTIYLAFLMCVPENVDRNNLYRIWKIIGLIAMTGLFYQSFQVYALGRSVSIIKIFPFLELAGNNVSLYGRPHSIFLEPAAYSTWILPLLCMSLARSEFVWAAIISVSIFFSTSSTGIIMVGISWLFFTIIGQSVVGRRNNRLILVSVLIIGFGVLTNTDLFSAGLNKLTNISLDDTSNNTRIMLGFLLYAGLPIVQKVFGIPYLSVESYLRSGNVELGLYGLSLRTSYLGFVNALGNCLLNYGIIGSIFYLRLFYKVFKDSGKADKCYVAICFASIFGQSVFWNSLFVTQFAVMLVGAKFKDYKKFTFGRGE